MNILYIGDIMGDPGIETVRQLLPEIKQAHNVAFTIAQAENVTDGKSMSLDDMKTLQKLGIDFFSGGNHTPRRSELIPLLQDDSAPVIGPANMNESPGKGWKIADTPYGQILVISLLGATVGREVEITNPLHAIDQILSLNQDREFIATVVNFHGDYSSEKRIIGYYLDGRVTAVIGDHWHVPTADAMVLPKGTAHITDVGMCGTLHSSLGVTFDSVVPRWRDGLPTRNVVASDKPFQFNALLIEVDLMSGLAKKVQHLQKIIE
jgi:2',3'-cyclic-nucleotide 2'-phosphodiesterase